jgi:DNA-binding CsgD family transcriptional regulator
MLCIYFNCMKFEESYLVERKNLLERLSKIRDVNFTPREIDILSCIFYNRSEKKIASILSISHRTVGTHIRNMMLKLTCNSRETILDFIHTSGKGHIIQQYYYQLLIQSYFKDKLLEIKNKFNRKPILCCAIPYQKWKENNTLVNIKNYLKLANIELIKTSHKNQDKENTLLNIELSEGNTKEKIELILTKPDDISAKPISALDIKISNDTEYYHSILNFIQQILNKKEIEQIISEFNKSCKALRSMNEPKMQEANSSKSLTKNSIMSQVLSNKFYYGIFSVTIFILISYLYTKKVLFNKEENLFTYKKAQQNSSICEIKKELKEFANLSRVSNVTLEFQKKNNSLINKIKAVIDLIDINDTVKHYLNSKEVDPSDVLNALHISSVIAGYETYYNFNAVEAKKYLLLGEKIARNFIINNNRSSINFDKLSKEEIYQEISIIEDLAEIYTVIIYMLGRTYLYHPDSKLYEGKKYFELSKFLGNKLNLFEGYLSELSGICRIKELKIEELIRNKNYDQARSKIIELAEIYTRLKNINKDFVLNYNPNKTLSTLHNPKNDDYTQSECSIRLSKCYNKLLKLSNNEVHKDLYIKNLIHEFIGTEESPGLLRRNIVDKKRAIGINLLGNIMLTLYDINHLDNTEFLEIIKKELNLKTAGLDAIEQIFNIAKDMTRSNSFPKADSYDGLMHIRQRMLSSSNIAKAKDITLLKKEILEFKQKRDTINKTLNRVQPEE